MNTALPDLEQFIVTSVLFPPSLSLSFHALMYIVYISFDEKKKIIFFFSTLRFLLSLLSLSRFSLVSSVYTQSSIHHFCPFWIILFWGGFSSFKWFFSLSLWNLTWKREKKNYGNELVAVLWEVACSSLHLLVFSFLVNLKDLSPMMVHLSKGTLKEKVVRLCHGARSHQENGHTLSPICILYKTSLQTNHK